MTDTEAAEARRKLAKDLRIEAERNREMAAESEGFPALATGQESCLRRAGLYESAAAEIERLDAECESRIAASNMSFGQAMSNGESAANLRAALEPFAAMRLSMEPEVSDCVLRSAGAEMRLRADALDKRDADILRARAALGLTPARYGKG